MKNKIKSIFPHSQVPMSHLFLHLSQYKLWVFIYDKFTGGVTLGTFNKEKMIGIEYRKNDTCQFIHGQETIKIRWMIPIIKRNKYPKSMLQIQLFTLFLSTNSQP